MSTDNEVIVSGSAYDLITKQVSKYADSSALAQVSSSAAYLPYIQLMGSNSESVKKGKFAMGHFCLTENKVNLDLGDSVVMFLIAWRPKCMQYNPIVIAHYDPNSEAFKKMKAEAELPSSKKGYGCEFLVWLPDHQKYATYFLGNKTGRREAPNLVTVLEKGSRKCRIAAEYIEDKKNDRGWHGPKMYPYDLELSNPPASDGLEAILQAFNNPPESQVEAAEKSEADSRG